MFLGPFRIFSNSMFPTLIKGDFILVNKMAYALKVPFLDNFYFFKKSSPQRGDVVVFKYPRDKSVRFIKRIIGIPGDIIEVRDKKVFINGKTIPLNKISNMEFNKFKEEKESDDEFLFYESWIGKRKFIVQLDQNSFYRTNFSMQKIPKEKYFVLGDNRDFSYDSRFWGVIPEENIEGRAFLIWLSLKIKIDRLGHSFKIYFDRICKVIQ